MNLAFALSCLYLTWYVQGISHKLAVKVLGVTMEPRRSWVRISVLPAKKLVMTGGISCPVRFFYPPSAVIFGPTLLSVRHDLIMVLCG